MDHAELTAKHEKVRFWLEDLFGDDIIPKYEINGETITYLHDKCEQNKEMDRLTNLLIDDINMKTEEYKIEAARMKEMLEGVGLPMYVLSNAGKSALKMLSQLASALDIKDVKKSSYILALGDFSHKLSDVIEDVSQKQLEISNQISQAETALKSLGTMSNYYDKLVEHSAVDIPVTEKRKQVITKMQSKTKGYKTQIIEDEKNMKISNVDKKLHHAALVRLSEELKSLKNELKPLVTKYQNYRSLPPDIHLAKVKIEETKRYMTKLEKELQTDIDYLAL